MRLCVKLFDNENKLHRSAVVELQDTATIRHLQREIHVKFQIEPGWQDLFDRNMHPIDILLDSKQLKEISISDGEMIILKHALLGIWIEYLEYCKNANDEKIIEAARMSNAHAAIKCSKHLDDSNFFLVYTKFGPKGSDTLGQMMRFVDRTQTALKRSATTFFSKKYPGSTIEFKVKQGGTRAGIVVTITQNSEEIDYYMKTYHHAGSSSSLQNTLRLHLPDLREIFAYRLLELIGVGSVVFFPFYTGSTYIHYIATKEVDGFLELDKIEDRDLQHKVVVEAYLLHLILGINDLNEGNIGSNSEKMLSIIDFYIPRSDLFLRTTIVNDFKDKSFFGGIGICMEFLTEVMPEERMKIAKNALPRWKMIADVTGEVIGVEKKEMREHGIEFGTATNDVDNYIENIKANYASMCIAFQ